MQIETQAGQTVFTGTASEIMEVLRGPRPAPQHDQHCKGWRWELYLQSAQRASAAVREEGLRIIARVNAQREAREAAYPPIPCRNFDWCAVDDDTYEPGCPIGWGKTEAEAIADLTAQMEEA